MCPMRFQSEKMKNGLNAKRITLDGILTALALIIFIVELQIPEIVPIPGVKLGLANVITLIVIFEIGPIDGLIVLILRIIMGSMFSGRIMAMIYSMAGGLLCYVVTLLLKRIVTKSQIWVCGVLGAISHNLGQIMVAVLITQTPELFSYLPVLVVSGMITGAFTGWLATFTVKKMGDRFGKLR